VFLDTKNLDKQPFRRKQHKDLMMAMNRRALMATFLCGVLICSFALAYVKSASGQSPKTIIVPNDYPTIGQAIGNATAGDIILLRNGTYTEQTIQINQSLTLESEYPNGATINLNPPQYTEYAFPGDVPFLVENFSVDIEASNVNLIGLTINVAAGSIENNINGGGGDINGNGDQIQLANVTTQSNVDLTGDENQIQTSSLGTLTLTGSNNSISTSSFGPILIEGDFNLLSNCNAPILQLSGSENIITGCSFIFSGTYTGPGAEIMLLANANSNIICNNTVVASAGYNGIELNPLAQANGASYNIIVGNKIEGAVGEGIWVWQNSSYNVFYGNLIANNVAPSPDRTDLGNGIVLGGASENVSYTLFFGNILKNNSHNFEAAQRVLGPVFFDNGTEGNYWDDYLTKCPNATEVDNTGTGSVPYPVGGYSSGNICDNHPLINAPAISTTIPDLPEPWITLLPIDLLSQIMPRPSDSGQILNPVSTPTPTSTPIPAPTPTPIATPSPTQAPETVQVKTASGATVDVAISGNVTSSQMSNAFIATNQSAATTAISFTVTGQSGTAGFCNMTIPKNAVAYGVTPEVYVDGQPAQTQGYTQDRDNYYVWYTTDFSTHQVNIVFTTTPNNTPVPTAPEFPIWIILPLIFAATLTATACMKRKDVRNAITGNI
jgi:hypothetical protein